MKYRVQHRTTYRYANPVDLAAHMLHLNPRTLPDRQRVTAASVVSRPEANGRTESIDHFGNAVTRLFIDQPHNSFEVTSEAVIEVTPVGLPDPALTPAWEEIAALAASGGPCHAAAEFRFASPLVPLAAETSAYAAKSFPAGRPVLEGLIDLNRRIRREFSYRPGATTISTPLSDVMARREGVCQDFAHLMIAGLRGLGLPARYVSGYLRTKAPPGMPVLRGADQSHAWVAGWIGPEFGWIELDPTNDLIVADEHVVLAWGRDFSDVSPVCGVILGGGAHSLSVGVDLTPL